MPSVKKQETIMSDEQQDPKTQAETLPNGEEQAETSVNAAEDALAEAQAEIGKLKEQILRAMAETENTRRRMKKEADDAQKFAVGSFAKEMLIVADNFRRALDAVPQQDGAGGDTLKNLIAGVEATERQLLAAFEKFGIKKLDPLNQPFDPHFHQVMMEVEDPSKPAGLIVQVLQAGYMIHDRLLREAMVVVAKGGPTVHRVDTAV